MGQQRQRRHARAESRLSGNQTATRQEEHTTSSHLAQTLGGVLDSIDTAILTTVDGSNRLASRPMTLCVDRFDSTVWFFAPMQSRVVSNVAANPAVNVSHCGPLASFSMAGTAILVPSLAPISARWSHRINVWFPDGMDDAAMIEVSTFNARLWRHRQAAIIAGLESRR
ncbi:MAG: pyridoxamine 5'-phosphate oxidase family protein [Mycobacterium sp.]|nr:pyridoxamine 5'-phosphate oxidase family protein [Mycobacterium sp.]